LGGSDIWRKVDKNAPSTSEWRKYIASIAALTHLKIKLGHR
jgi:hypothetical protein